MLSVVLPVLNDEKTEWTERILRRLMEVEGIEVLRGAGKTRAERLQRGIDASRGDMILLHHPRSLVERAGLEWLRDHAEELEWGGFTHRFDADHYLLRFTSWYSNRVRPRHGILYLDHCIFFRRELLTRSIPAVEIFEDTELSKILRERARPRVLPFLSTTSAVRFTTRGVWRQALLNQLLKLEYRLGRSPQDMNDRYERGLRLNG
ncbi:MAG: glycosyl transferase, family 2 [Elusimicrobia bacterium CG_4_9_14_3_um_filter_62_55]|nr:MAG: glycosyl transferase, family 2 [Elusimicrobia bacterium CG22_combo_CG10-13_8_21_14_all_63_91]PJA14175.1 MAG: glycosyl transferase, family 2 [Elusimicrobia bacterium CG_4_10_14_0_2_um_filter_63_34]PJB24429.1 MAG: glycosyl transferase, family 2 [Elusimicrobia bacterium CG_4_9_14_3_um_filter_62_55]